MHGRRHRRRNFQQQNELTMTVFKKPSPKQAIAAMKFVEHGDKTRACAEAGYSQKGKRDTVIQSASRLFALPHMVAHVEGLQAEHRQRHKATIDRVIEELTHIAFARFDDFHRVDEATGYPQLDLRIITDPNKFAAIASSKMKVKMEQVGPDEFEEVRELEVKFNDKQAALVTIGKHLGLFKDTVVHEGEIAMKAAAASFDDQFSGFTEAANKAAASALA